VFFSCFLVLKRLFQERVKKAFGQRGRTGHIFYEVLVWNLLGFETTPAFVNGRLVNQSPQYSNNAFPDG
jgi:hypothetical protein